jgi:putative ABC transport system substrate-binding protein
VLFSDNAASKLAFAAIERDGAQFGVQVQPLYVAEPYDLTQAFEQAGRWPADGLLVRGDLGFVSHATQLAELAARWHVPVMASYREQVVAGSLIAYGASLSEDLSRAGAFVDKILRGAKPADMPVEQLDTPHVVVNLNTVRALGLTIPSDVAVQVTDWVQ